MIDHLTIRVRDPKASVAFFKAALAPLGYEVLMEYEGFYGLGANKKPDLWIAKFEKTPQQPMHVAFRAPNRKAVHAFYDAALAAGGKDNGAAGPRKDYSPTYYGAFVIDPDGNNVEACCHEAE